MIIECPACHARYQIAQSIRPPGRKVRCGKCAEVWWVDATLDSAAGGAESTSPAAGRDPAPGLATQADWETARAARLAAEAARPQVNTMRLGTPSTQRAEAPALSFHPDVSPPEAHVDAHSALPPRSPPPPPPLSPRHMGPEPYAHGDPAHTSPHRPMRPTLNWPPETGLRSGPIRIGAADDHGRPGPQGELHGAPPPPPSRGASVVPSRTALPEDERAPEPGDEEWRRQDYAPEQRRSWLGMLGSLLVIMSAAGLLAYAFLARHHVVRWLPAANGIYAALGLPMTATSLVVRNVKAEWLTDTNAPLLVVRGEVFNPARHEQKAPPVLLELRDAADRSLYQTTVRTGSVVVSKGGMTRFVARIPPPSAAVASVSVRLR